MAAAYVPSIAAESSIIAAFLTRGGLVCGMRALDGNNGLLALLSDQPNIDGALAGLGESAIAAEKSFKPYPSGFVTHAVIDDCLALNSRATIDPLSLHTIRFDISPSAHSLGANPNPAEVPEAQVSVPHWAAMALLHDRAVIAEADVRWVADPKVAALRGSIIVAADPSLRNDHCRGASQRPAGNKLKSSSKMPQVRQLARCYLMTWTQKQPRCFAQFCLEPPLTGCMRPAATSSQLTILQVR